MAELIPWWQLLPQAPDLSGRMQLQNQALQLKIQEAQRQQAGYNAMAQLFRDPSNLQNGMLKPEALSQLAGIYPPAALDLMKEQATIGQQRQMSALRGQEFVQKMNQASAAELAPLLSVYDKDKGEIGDQAALQKYQAARAEAIERMAQSGNYTPQFIEGIRRNPGDPEALRAAVLGSKAIQTPAEQRAETRADTQTALALRRESRETAKAQASAAQPTLIGMMDDGKGGKAEVRYRYDEQGKAVDEQGNAVDTSKLTGVRKIGTKGEEDVSQAGLPTGPADAHGEEYLKALPASRSALVRGYAEGRVPFPGSFSLRSPYWQKMVADITQYDPSFDAVNYNARARTRQDFTQGKSAQNITSFNTAIGHLGTLNKAVDELNNTAYPWWNWASNRANVAGGNQRFQAAQKRFEAARTAVADELERAFRGTGGNVTGIEQWRQAIDTSDSPAALHAAVGQAVELLASRINSVGEQYQRGMGTTADVTDLLTPSAKKTLRALPNGQAILGEAGLRRQGTRGAPKGAQSAEPEIKPAETVEPAPATGGAVTGGMEIRKGHEKEDWDKIPSGSRYIWNGKVGIKP